MRLQVARKTGILRDPRRTGTRFALYSGDRRDAAAGACTIGLIGVFLTTACVPSPRTPVSVSPPATDVESTLFLIGDAGNPDPDGDPVFIALTADAGSTVGTRIILFLGDNVYPRGIPAPDAPGRDAAERRLAAQVAVPIAAGARGIFIPGNHDWDYAGEGRREQLLRAEALIEQWGEGRVEFLPTGACPGPAMLDIDSRVRLILMDTQWWLFPHPAEEIPDYCEAQTKEDMLEGLRAALDASDDRVVVFAGHHPLATGGTHGGHFTLRQHLFPLTDQYKWAWIPLPIIGSLYPIARNLGISDQDLSGGPYRELIDAFSAVLRDHPPLVYAAGHEHSLQVIADDAPHYHVVSGSGYYGHTSPVKYIAGTLFARAESGYVKIEFQRDGRVRLAVMVVNGDATYYEAYATDLR